MKRHCLLLLAQIVSLSAFAADDIIGVASVTDGDTIVIHEERIRLEGVDSPETRQICMKGDQK